MAETIIAAGAGELLNKLSSLLTQEIVLAWGVKGDLMKLERTLPMLQSVTEDAEERQAKDKNVGLWLKAVKDVAYDAEDILDEFAYEAFLREMKKKVRNFISLSNPIVFRFKMAHKIRSINERLDELKKEMVDLKLIKRVLGAPLNLENKKYYRETCSITDHAMVIGREEEKSKIVDILINSGNEESLSIIPIVGMGGLGKTTLARLVYYDEQIEESFKDLKMWVYVSEDFDVRKIMQAIIESATGGSKQKDYSSLEMTVRELQKHLSGKKFLLALDDVWNESYEEMEKLKHVLLCGIKGSKVVVTTRKHEVASIMGTLPKCQLESLSGDESWSLFEQRAFGTKGGVERTTADLVAIGKEIVKKCRGVPLVLNTIGALLHDKREKNEWLSIKNKVLFQSEHDHDGILQVLKLSYDNLSAQMKRCFLFCSIFPKGNRINKDTLIQLWVAEGLLEQSINGSDQLLEDVGHNFVQKFFNDSFFQDEERDEVNWDQTYFKKHDFFHDLARFLSSYECTIVEASKVESFNSINARRLRVAYDGESMKCLKNLKKFKKLRVITFGGVSLMGANLFTRTLTCLH